MVGSSEKYRRRRKRSHSFVDSGHLWIVFRAEWEITKRLRMILQAFANTLSDAGVFRLSLRKAKRLHRLVELLVETPYAAVPLVRSIKRVATIRNNLVHQTDYLRIRNLLSFDATFVQVIRSLDLIVCGQAAQNQNVRSVPFPYSTADNFFFPSTAIDLSKQIEVLLKERLSAEGKGLLEKFRSVAHFLPDSARRSIATFARERNNLIHNIRRLRASQQSRFALDYSLFLQRHRSCFAVHGDGVAVFDGFK